MWPFRPWVVSWCLLEEDDTSRGGARYEESFSSRAGAVRHARGLRKNKWCTIGPRSVILSFRRPFGKHVALIQYHLARGRVEWTMLGRLECWRSEWGLEFGPR
jgi:hypothetical protein